MTKLQQFLTILSTGKVNYERRDSIVVVESSKDGCKTTFLFDGPGEMLLEVTSN